MKRRSAELLFLLAGAALLAACDHTAPLEYEPPEALPPASDELPLRLTFSSGADRGPAVSGGVLAYSRVDEAPGSRDRCIGLMPTQGGTLLAILCPPPRTEQKDSVTTWVEPVVSPDGTRIAYVHQKSSLEAVLGTGRHFHVAPLDDLTALEFRWMPFLILPDGRTMDALMKPSWRDSTTIRFLAARDFIPKVKGGGAERFTDTTLIALALMEVDLVTGEVAVVPGADSAIAYAPAPDGGTWIVTLSDRTRLLHQAQGSSGWVEVGTFLGEVLDLASVDGLAMAVLTDSATIEGLVPETGEHVPLAWCPPTWVKLPNCSSGSGRPAWVLRVAGVPGTRTFVAEIEMPIDSFGGSANLWLLELP